MADKGMFTALMEAAEKKESRPSPATEPTREKEPRTRKDESLAKALEDLSETGYTSHSYRFTESELRWLRRFCLRASERLDRQISHNTLIRLLFRLANDEWNTNPNKNRLVELLSHLKD